MKILVIGSGGREHAMVWALQQSRRGPKIYCAPGNGGTAKDSTNVPIPSHDIEQLSSFAKQEGIDLTWVGPELPLTLGIVDHFEKSGLRIIGPSASAARLEGSKAYAKAFMQRHGIPTSPYVETSSYEEAIRAVHSGRFGFPLVIKADGLAAGKGVVIAKDASEAEFEIDQILRAKVLGEAGRRIVLEQFLVGEEISFLVFSDGRSAVPMVPSQDHKTIFDDDRGPNTGGMGAYSADWILSPGHCSQVMDRIVTPTLEGMAVDGMPYKGILYVGLMLTDHGLHVLEYNVRMGDPETQPVLFRLKSDLIDVCEAMLDRSLSEVRLQWDSQCSVCVVLASGGYPGEFQRGMAISGIAQAEASLDVKVFHAGTELKDGGLVTTGGRVLGVTARGETLRIATDRAYDAAEKISFRNMHFRRDIGRKGLTKEQARLG